MGPSSKDLAETGRTSSRAGRTKCAKPGSAGDSTGPLRRLPAQRRSAERVRRMLDACAEILDESGYEGLSTTGIARRAGVAIGSIYQFFPDKRAVAQALTLRHLDLLGERVAGRLADEPPERWSDAVAAVLDVYVDMRRSVAGFRVLGSGDVVDAHLLDAGLDNNAVIVDRLRALLVGAGLDDTPELAGVLAVAFEAGDAVLRLAFRRDGDGDARILAEAERLIRGYLATHLD